MLANYNMKLSKILYHRQLSTASFRFCETYLLHIKPFVGNQSAISPFLGGFNAVKEKREGELDHCLRCGNEEMALQMQ